MLFALLVLVCSLMIVSDIRICKEDFNIGYLTRDSSLSIRGGVALFIVLHHLSQHTEVTEIFTVFGYIGFILVAVFFFLSGYGLKFGLNNKNNYLDGFLIKHFSSIIIPFWTLGCVRFIFELYEKKLMNLNEAWEIFFGFHRLWFIAAILIFYSMFWIAYRFFQKNAFVVLCIELTLYVVVCLLLKIHSSWTASTIAFLVGVVWADKKNEIDVFIRKNWLVKCLGIGAIFSILFVGRLVLVQMKFDNIIFQCILRNLVSGCFVVFLLLLLQKVSFRNKILDEFGKRSLAIYMSHCVFLSYANDEFIVFFTLTILTVIIVDMCSNKSKRKIGSFHT